MPRQFYDDSDDPPVNPIWKPDYNREPHWKDLNEDDIELFYERVKGFISENEEVDNIDWSRMNFDVVDADFYREHIKGEFPEEFYALLAETTNKENKVQDFRMMSLDIKREETVLSFTTGPEEKIEEKLEDLKIE